MPVENVSLAIQASSAIPGFFLPVKIKNMVLADGGLFDNVGIA
jgi:predicted acylesterase/phospholipase RssA